MYRLPTGLWWEVFLVLSINILLYASYHTGFSVLKMLHVPSWRNLSAKPLPANLRRHAIAGLAAGGAMFLGSLYGVLQGGMDSLTLLSLALAFLLLVTGTIRMFGSGSGQLHLVVAVLALAIFTYRAALVMPSLGRQVLSLGQASATPTASRTLRDTVQAAATAAAPVQNADGTLVWKNILIQGKASGDLPGNLRVNLQEVMFPAGTAQVPGEVKGSAALDGPGGGPLFQGQLQGLIDQSGMAETLLTLEGQGKNAGKHLELVGLFPVGETQAGTTVPLYLQGEYVPKLQVAKFGSPAQLPPPAATPSGGNAPQVQSGC